MSIKIGNKHRPEKKITVESSHTAFGSITMKAEKHRKNIEIRDILLLSLKETINRKPAWRLNVFFTIFDLDLESFRT